MLISQERLPAMVGLAAMLLAALALMWRPMREETATVDETTFMGGGYAYLTAGTARMAEENPMLSQMIIAAPMLFLDVQVSDNARALLQGRAFAATAFPWRGPPAPLTELFPDGPNWYHVGMVEAQLFGQWLVYEPRNDAPRLLFWSRLPQAWMTLGTAVLLFFWARRLAGGRDEPGLMAAALWLFNPVTLGFGHLAITEPGVCLAYPLAVWWFVRTLEAPTLRNWGVFGVLTAVAMHMKFTSLLLGPTCVVLAGLWWLWPANRSQRSLPAAKILAARAGLAVAGFWAVTLAVYFADWSAPPPIDTAQARMLGVPGWLLAFRPLLAPGDFFRAVALKILKSQTPQSGVYLMGQWSDGWWYYYPVATFFKTPEPWLAMIGLGAFWLARRRTEQTFAAWAPWVAAALFMALSTTSKLNIGMRHVMPIFPLLAVGIAHQIGSLGRNWRWAGWGLCAWLAAIVLWAWPYFIPYCNLLAGGTSGGYRYVLDSNYDWGQDGWRLKQWMGVNAVEHIHLDYFGTQAAIEWHQIPHTRVNAEQARGIEQGYLVVSVSNLMRPEWDWLREQHQPVARVAHTLFVYRLP
jgi:hypothetical protein